MDLKSYGVGDAVFSEGGSLKRFDLLMRVRVVLTLVAPSNRFRVAVDLSSVAITGC
jgi:hypothetical protein